jgi:regulator of nonsense transcripts 2
MAVPRHPQNLDERAKALISSAMYSVKPPPAGPKKQAKVYPPLEAYLRDLLLVRLVPEGSSISFVTKQLGRFPWDDPSQQCGALICKYMMKACRKGRYKAINAVAAVAAKFKRTKPEVATRLLDNVLEELRWSLEHPDFRDQQRSITYAKLLGELYRLSVAPAQIVIQQLFDFVNIGHEIPEALREASAKLESGESTAQSDLALLNSSKKGISQTIQEDEELDEDAMQGADEEVPEPQQQVVAVSRHSKYDPRVPTQADPPNAVLRIQLVCTLLESASTPLLSRSNIQDTEKFLVAFQRYLFTKTSLPTEVEFALLDTFDVMDSRWRSAGRDAGRDRKDSGFPRFKTWLEAHNATVAFEEAEALTDLKTRARLEGIAGLSQGTGETDSMTGSEEADDESVGLSLASEDASMEDHSASVSDSASYEENEEMGESGSISDESSQEDEDASDEETSEGSNESDADDLGSSEEEAVDEEELLRQLEEEAFERELRRMTMEALEKGKSTAGRKVADTMPSGSQFIRKKAAETTQDTAGAAMALGGKEGISFQLLKKGNKGKVEAKSLVVPSDTNLAKVATKQDDEAARERDLLKARVLEYEAQSAEQDNAGGNVYLEESKLQTIRNRPLSIEEIDKNFGSTRGETPGSVNRRPGAPSSSKPRSHQGSSSGRGRGGGSGRSGGRGRGRSGRGRSLV